MNKYQLNTTKYAKEHNIKEIVIGA